MLNRRATSLDWRWSIYLIHLMPHRIRENARALATNDDDDDNDDSDYDNNRHQAEETSRKLQLLSAVGQVYLRLMNARLRDSLAPIASHCKSGH